MCANRYTAIRCTYRNYPHKKGPTMRQPIFLQPLLERYLGGDIPLYQLRGQFYSGSVNLDAQADRDLYQPVSMHLAMFTVGDWPEATLKDAIRWHIDEVNGEAVSAPMPMIDRQWLEIIDSGVAPWPIEVTEVEVDDEQLAAIRSYWGIGQASD